MKQFKEIAKSAPRSNVSSEKTSRNHSDGLLKGIRNSKDAALFTAELDAAIEQSK